MKNKLMITAAAALIVGFTASVQAVPINGTISFDGTITVSGGSGDLGTATGIASYANLSVDAGTETGTYAGLNAGGGNGLNGISALSFSTFGFGGNVLSPSPLVPLWTVTFGGNVYSFTATDVTIVAQTSSPEFLNLSGDGIAYLNGGDATLGTWTITDTGSSPIFTFGASTVVPDGGTTVALLGLGLGACALVGRKMRKLA